MTARSLFLVLSAAALAAASPALAECKLQKAAEVPVTMQGLRPVVAAKINGQDTRFIISTGSVFGGVSDEAAARLSMKKSIAPFGMTVRSLGGQSADARAVEADLTFAGAQWKNMQFLVGGRAGTGDVAGVIGQNILGAFDVEYDFANGVIRFFQPEGCDKANLAYWSSGMALQRIQLDNPGRFLQHVKSTAKVDGHTVKINFDSGASVSYLSKPAAARLGIQPQNEGVVAAGLTYGAYGKGLETFIAPFASFAIGDEEIKNTKLRVANIDLPDADMILGDDFFLSHRIYVARSQSKIYITYNGGPVFRLEGSKPAQVAAATTTPAPGSASGPASGAEAAAPAGGTLTAAEYARRGAGAAARREFAQAIEDYSHAIDLAPDDAANYHARALARLNARQPVLAMADLGEALKHDPNDVQALMVRGELYLSTRDPTRGRADFEAALQLAPDNHDLLYRVGLDYTRAGFFEDGIRQLDSWVSIHPKAENLPQVLSARCWTRAAWGKELEKALADCDAAMRKDHNSQVMQNRALVLLRLGRVDEAIVQYNAALKLQPRAAWSLYGRGLAEQKKGQAAAADADIQAATAIAPGLPAEAKRYGLAAEAAPAAAAKS
jgi:tetratricopeptide (TPR) repeat protein/predicted aspartyl protease